MSTHNKFQVKPSTEPGFSLNNCFQNIKEGTQGYVKDQDYYFDSYSHFNIHEDMLKDKTRTLAYKNAIMKNKHLFEGKIVLDVGCGTGILSIFAAWAGAQHVYGVENANIAYYAQKIVEANQLSHKITIVKGKIESIVLPVEKVDIIISEWMGYFLLYEAMLDSVIHARDKFLQKDGMMFPDRAVLYLSTIEDAKYKEQKMGFWDEVYGADMSCIKEWVLKEPLIDIVEPNQVNGDNCVILDLNLQTVQKTDLDFCNEYEIRMNRDDKIHAFIAWFDVMFTFGHQSLTLSTSPFGKETHWKQVVFYTEDLKVFRDDIVKGSIAVKKCTENPRELDVKLSVHIDNKAQTKSSIYLYRLN